MVFVRVYRVVLQGLLGIFCGFTKFGVPIIRTVVFWALC